MVFVALNESFVRVVNCIPNFECLTKLSYIYIYIYIYTDLFHRFLFFSSFHFQEIYMSFQEEDLVL